MVPNDGPPNDDGVQLDRGRIPSEPKITLDAVEEARARARSRIARKARRERDDRKADRGAAEGRRPGGEP